MISNPYSLVLRQNGKYLRDDFTFTPDPTEAVKCYLLKSDDDGFIQDGDTVTINTKNIHLCYDNQRNLRFGEDPKNCFFEIHNSSNNFEPINFEENIYFLLGDLALNNDNGRLTLDKFNVSQIRNYTFQLEKFDNHAAKKTIALYRQGLNDFMESYKTGLLFVFLMLLLALCLWFNQD